MGSLATVNHKRGCNDTHHGGSDGAKGFNTQVDFTQTG